MTATISGVDTISGAKVKKGMGPFFWLASGWVIFVALGAIFADLLPLPDPNDPSEAGFSVGPLSPGAFLGTDGNGRDLLSRLLYGGRVSLTVGVMTILVGFAVGGLIGMVAGYFRGLTDQVFGFLSAALLSFPPLLFLLLMVAVLSGGNSETGGGGGLAVWKFSVVLAFLAIPTLSRVVRASTLSFAQREFVTAARTMGAKSSRILSREIFPNVVKPMLSFSLIAVANVMVIEGTLSFLGLGVKSGATSWGQMIVTGQSRLLAGLAYMSLIPGAWLFVTALSLNYVGDRLQERFDVKQGAI